MESNKKKFYSILFIVTVVLFAIIMFYPVKKKDSAALEEQGIITTAAAVTAEAVESINLLKEESSSYREPERDIFSSRYELHEDRQSSETAAESEIKEVKEEIKPPVVKGVFISESGNSFLTGDGKMVSEGEKIESLKVMKILKEEVIFKKPDGKLLKVNIWEE